MRQTLCIRAYRILRPLALLCGLALLATASHAAPPIWESDFGTPIVFSVSTDDGTEDVQLLFAFPFAGSTYDVASVNTNGGIALANTVGDEVYVDFDIWNSSYFESDFTDLGSPSLLAFNNDLNITNEGTIYYNGSATRAVFTFERIPSYLVDDQPFITFQIQIFSDGRIVYGYNGLFGNLIADVDQGIVIGISDGDGDTPPGGIDYTDDTPHSGGTTIYQIWCHDSPTNTGCFETGQDNSGFDLDQCNLIFTPDGSTGFTVTQNCGGIIFTTEALQHIPTPSGLVTLKPTNGYQYNDDGTITLVFDGAALKLPAIDCIDRRRDGSFAFSPAVTAWVPTPSGLFRVWHHNVYRVEPGGGFSVLFNGGALGIRTNGCDTD
jgi:hypothetical protein